GAGKRWAGRVGGGRVRGGQRRRRGGQQLQGDQGQPGQGEPGPGGRAQRAPKGAGGPPGRGRRAAGVRGLRSGGRSGHRALLSRARCRGSSASAPRSAARLHSTYAAALTTAIACSTGRSRLCTASSISVPTPG